MRYNSLFHNSNIDKCCYIYIGEQSQENKFRRKKQNHYEGKQNIENKTKIKKKN
jgi:hypothetical protein